MIPAKEFEGELWIKASDHHRAIKTTQRPLIDLTDEDWNEIEDMPDTFDQGVAWAQAKLKERNA